MGRIIGEGITFDDVLLVPAYSEVIPNQVDVCFDEPDKKGKAEYTVNECGDGYRNRAPHGNRDGETWRYWRDTQKHVD